jgi:NAD(P)-dependent dehydrogenase (short-subunit alcohol dehydrogenase family)
LANLTECLAEELKTDKISVNCLALGSVNTEMLQEAFPGFKAPTNAADMARFIAWFSLNAGRLMNGKIVPMSVNTP